MEREKSYISVTISSSSEDCGQKSRNNLTDIASRDRVSENDEH